MKVDKAEYQDYIEAKIQAVIIKNKDLHRFFVDSRLPRTGRNLFRWKILVKEEIDLFIGNWASWMTEVADLLLADLKRVLPSCEFEYEPLTKVTRTGVTLGLVLSLVKSKR